MTTETETVSVFKTDTLICDIKTILYGMINSIDIYFTNRVGRANRKEFNQYVKKYERDLMASILYNMDIIKLSVDEIFKLRKQEEVVEMSEKSNLIQGPWAGSGV